MLKYYDLFIILNTLDLVGSYILLEPGQELNPICAHIWSMYGFEGLVMFKVLMTAFPIAAINYYHKTEPKRAKYAIILANVIVTIPVVLLGYLWILL